LRPAKFLPANIALDHDHNLTYLTIFILLDSGAPPVA
jgi:hypothetical protein